MLRVQSHIPTHISDVVRERTVFVEDFILLRVPSFLFGKEDEYESEGNVA